MTKVPEADHGVKHFKVAVKTADDVDASSEPHWHLVEYRTYPCIMNLTELMPVIAWP